LHAETHEDDAQPLHRGTGTYTRKAYATQEAPTHPYGVRTTGRELKRAVGRSVAQVPLLEGGSTGGSGVGCKRRCCRRSLNLASACGAMRRFGVAPRVKLNPRNLRCDGGATALLALLILSFSRRYR